MSDTGVGFTEIGRRSTSITARSTPAPGFRVSEFDFFVAGSSVQGKSMLGLSLNLEFTVRMIFRFGVQGGDEVEG